MSPPPTRPSTRPAGPAARPTRRGQPPKQVKPTEHAKPAKPAGASATRRTSPASGLAPEPGRPPLDLGILPRLTGYQLRLAQIRVFRHFALALAAFDLTPGLLGVLVIVGANRGLKQTELAQAVRLDRSTMVGVIDKLEARGWVQRRATAGDRRAHGLWLTAAGERALALSLEAVQRHERHIARELSAAETKTLASLLARVCL